VQGGKQKDTEARRTRSGAEGSFPGARAWSVAGTGDGSWTLVCGAHGEACQSLAGAWTQARERYADACRVHERALAGECVRLLDVGTGLGLNLAAALAAVEGTAGALECVSLEHEPGVIAAAIEAAARLGPAVPAHGRVLAALAAALPGEPVRLAQNATLELVLGDARTTLPALAPERRFDAVFLDPFSRRVEPELWGPEFLAEMARRLARGGTLSTFSASFAVRVALARAGLRVGRGARVGSKAEGTLASPDLSLPPLPARVARRLARHLLPPRN
jgi:tRNA U34 5-methylaminomethyl-2-thiouridine-forming methyltransferase MnmC